MIVNVMLRVKEFVRYIFEMNELILFLFYVFGFVFYEVI